METIRDPSHAHGALRPAPFGVSELANSGLIAPVDSTARPRAFRPGPVATKSATQRSDFQKNVELECTHSESYAGDESSVVVLVVDNLPHVREAIAKVLTELSLPVMVVTASSIEAAASYQQPFDLILLDLNLPGHRNFESIALMRARRKNVPIMVRGAQDDSQTVLAALDNGAMGFIPKRYSHEDIASAVRIVLSGGVYVPPMAAQGDLAEPHGFHRRATDITTAADPRLQRRRSTDSITATLPREKAVPHATYPEPPTLNITPRQSQVLSLLIRGLCNKSICRELSLAENTVKSHIAAIFKALGVHSRTSAVVAMSNKGYVLAAS